MLLASESQNPSRAEVRTWRSGNHGGVVAVPTARLLEIVPFLQVSAGLQKCWRPSLHPLTTRRVALCALHASVSEAALQALANRRFRGFMACTINRDMAMV